MSTCKLREEIRSSVASFMASVEECISERECKLYDERLKFNSKVKLSLHRTFSKKLKSICMG